MPKDEFDIEDPLELNGAVVPCEEDNDEAMAVAFIEEFLFLGFTSDRIFAIFKDNNHVGPNRVYRRKGEAYVRELIDRTLEPWTRSE